ncbi:D-amino-acid dehydrogenase small subunit [Streptomyces azureus]|uniref:D-amino-acid dehydrogenase small subunit n=1 Tax=Streptomyces azureus TaxID=146537 RepID=A0A0K8PPT4_STRAJ|nr:FAD-dependent oxidoreductase [Streptomyces azureus]GAP49890.1 D-amino-acid dehydrogenase small subunit [Streptomyces azureus]
MTGAEARESEPALSSRVDAAVRLCGRRHLDPGAFVGALADAVRDRGGKIVTGLEVTRVRDLGTGAVALARDSTSVRADAAALTPGAWFGRLAAPFGVRIPVQSGRGYSFSLPAAGLPTRPTYFAERRGVCAPLGGRVRVAGMMEFTTPDRPADPRRIAAIVNSVRDLLPSAGLTHRTDEWAGPRPCTAEGLPPVGPTRSGPVPRLRRPRHVGHRPGHPQRKVAGGVGRHGPSGGRVDGTASAAVREVRARPTGQWPPRCACASARRR